jgi:hypothetical protein
VSCQCEDEMCFWERRRYGWYGTDRLSVIELELAHVSKERASRPWEMRRTSDTVFEQI